MMDMSLTLSAPNERGLPGTAHSLWKREREMLIVHSASLPIPVRWKGGLHPKSHTSLLLYIAGKTVCEKSSVSELNLQAKSSRITYCFRRYSEVCI